MIQKNLGNLRKSNESREDYEKSLNSLLQSQSRNVGKNIAQTYEERVKLFETDIEKKNKQAEEFVKKM